MQAGTAHKEQPVPSQNQQSQNTKTEEQQRNELNKTSEGLQSQIKATMTKNLHGFGAIFLQTLDTAVGLWTEYLIRREI